LRENLFRELRKFIKRNRGVITRDTLSEPSLNSGYSLDFYLNDYDVSSGIEIGGDFATLGVCANIGKK
jgi:hypothetical protein